MQVQAERAAKAAEVSGASTAIVFGLTATQWQVIGVIGGLVVAAAGFLVSWYYNREGTGAYIARISARELPEE